MPKVLTMLEVDNLKAKNEDSNDVQPLSRQECRNLIKTIESKNEMLLKAQQFLERYENEWRVGYEINFGVTEIPETEKDYWGIVLCLKEMI